MVGEGSLALGRQAGLSVQVVTGSRRCRQKTERAESLTGAHGDKIFNDKSQPGPLAG